MQVKQWLALSAVAFAASSVMAAEANDTSAPLTRAQVAQSVIEARAAGQLRPAGEADDYERAPARTDSTLTRAEVRRETIAARSAGQLEPAGEAADEVPGAFAANTVSTVTRAEVKAETLRARAAGELAPAGEDSEGISAQRTAHVTPRMSNPLARVFRSGTPTAQ